MARHRVRGSLAERIGKLLGARDLHCVPQSPARPGERDGDGGTVFPRNTVVGPRLPDPHRALRGRCAAGRRHLDAAVAAVGKGAAADCGDARDVRRGERRAAADGCHLDRARRLVPGPPDPRPRPCGGAHHAGRRLGRPGRPPLAADPLVDAERHDERVQDFPRRARGAALPGARAARADDGADPGQVLPAHLLPAHLGLLRLRDHQLGPRLHLLHGHRHRQHRRPLPRRHPRVPARAGVRLGAHHARPPPPRAARGAHGPHRKRRGPHQAGQGGFPRRDPDRHVFAALPAHRVLPPVPALLRRPFRHGRRARGGQDEGALVARALVPPGRRPGGDRRRQPGLWHVPRSAREAVGRVRGRDRGAGRAGGREDGADQNHRRQVRQRDRGWDGARACHRA